MSKQFLLGGVAIGVLVIGGAIGWYTLVDHGDQAASTAEASLDSGSTLTPTPTPQYLTVEEAPMVTTASIFAATPAPLPERLDPNKLFTVVTTGDVIPARGVDAQIRQNGPDYPFKGAGISPFLQQADVTIANLEAPLLTNCPAHDTGFTFCGQASFATSLATAGIDLVTMANNHIGNYGQAGILETMKHVSDTHMDYSDNSHLAIQTVKGIKIGTLAFSGVGGQFYPETIKQQIALARPQVDLLFVAYHWGKEYEAFPQSDPNVAPDDPIAIGRMTIEAGADQVIGNHPHWVQGAEVYKNKFISYAMGNFIFDQSWSTETMQGSLGRYTFYGTKLVKVEYLPVHIFNQAQPRFAEGAEKDQILTRMKDSTTQIEAIH